MRRLLLAAAAFSFGFSLACQSYDFRKVTGVPVEVIHKTVHQQVLHLTPPDILIVQDLSGSMCEPIQQTDPGGKSCLATDGGQAGYCSVCLPGGGPPPSAGDCATGSSACAAKISLVSDAMQTVLNDLPQVAGQLYLGLASFPSDSQCGTGQIDIPVGDATTTIPQIVSFYGSAAPNGGTPTAATLSAVVSADPLMSNPDPNSRKFIILITDGLPNCNGTNPCGSAPWSDGQVHACESPRYLASLTDGGFSATPAAGCFCSNGSCESLEGNQADCCTYDPATYPQIATEECLDDVNTVQAIADLYTQQGIRTYVVGMGYDYGSNPGILDEMADAGGGNPTAYKATSPQGLLAAIQSVVNAAAASVGCVFTLDAPAANPALIEVTFNGTRLSPLPPGSHGTGYVYLPPPPDGGPAAVDVEGSDCDLLLDGGAANLQITEIAQ